MKSQVLALILAAGCVPSRTSVFGPVDREIERRVGVSVMWHENADARVPAAVASLLQNPLDRDSVVRIALATNRRLQAQYDQLGIAASDVAAATVLAPLESTSRPSSRVAASTRSSSMSRKTFWI